MKNNFKKDFFWNLIGFGLYCFNSMLFLIIVTRIYGIEQAGIFSYAYILASIISQIALYGGRSYQVTDPDRLEANGVYISLKYITSLVSLLIAIIILIINNDGFHQSIILLLLCLVKITDAISDVYHGIIQGGNKLYIVGKSLFYKTIISIMGFAIINYYLRDIYISILFLLIISLLFLFNYDIKIAQKIGSIKIKFDKQKFKEIFRNCFYLFSGSFISTYIINIPRYAINHYLSSSDQGIYGILIMPAFVVVLLASFITQPFLLELSELYNKKSIKQFISLVTKIAGSIFLIFVFIFICAYFLGIPVLNIIYKVDLSSYKFDLIIVIFAALIYALISLLFTIMTLTRKIRPLFYMNIMILLIGYVISYYLVKSMYLRGGIISFGTILFVQLILFSIYFFISFKQNKECNKC